MEVRNLILNGEVKPTVRPVTEAVTDIIRQKAHLLGIKPSLLGKPQRQQIAQTILQTLEQENRGDAQSGWRGWQAQNTCCHPNMNRPLTGWLFETATCTVPFSVI
ncbi:MAG: hypothetical protein R3E95_04040 [Thiolinea sp.]